MEIIRREAQSTWCNKCEKTQPHVLTESMPLAYFLFSYFKREMMKKYTKECNICGEKRDRVTFRKSRAKFYPRR